MFRNPRSSAGAPEAYAGNRLCTRHKVSRHEGTVRRGRGVAARALDHRQRLQSVERIYELFSLHADNVRGDPAFGHYARLRALSVAVAKNLAFSPGGRVLRACCGRNTRRVLASRPEASPSRLRAPLAPAFAMRRVPTCHSSRHDMSEYQPHLKPPIMRQVAGGCSPKKQACRSCCHGGARFERPCHIHDPQHEDLLRDRNPIHQALFAAPDDWCPPASSGSGQHNRHARCWQALRRVPSTAEADDGIHR